jgi:hypothetical protein
MFRLSLSHHQALLESTDPFWLTMFKMHVGSKMITFIKTLCKTNFCYKNRVFCYFKVVSVYKNDMCKELDVCVWSALLWAPLGIDVKLFKMLNFVCWQTETFWLPKIVLGEWRLLYVNVVLLMDVYIFVSSVCGLLHEVAAKSLLLPCVTRSFCSNLKKNIR